MRHFFPESRHAFCLTCSPHRAEHVALGYKDGMIIVMDISMKGEVIRRLRGHDGEIHSIVWCPEPGEGALQGRGEDGAGGEEEEEDPAGEPREGGSLLASGSRDQTVRVWSFTRGKVVMTLKLPCLKRRGGSEAGVKERIWVAVHWPPARPTQLVSSSFGGELLLWDLTKPGKQRWTLLGPTSEAQNHSRIVFNLSSARLAGGQDLLFSISMDREVSQLRAISLSRS
uniref:Gem-associated protein 5-like n=1 Tax=Callorhinchus milii TaxID=7868 RepID=A0A4W3GL49_CALMI